MNLDLCKYSGLTSLWAFGRGSEFRRNGGPWAEFLSQHQQVIATLDVAYNRFKDRIAKICEKCPTAKLNRSYAVSSGDPQISDNDFLSLTLGRGHVAEYGRYVADCQSHSVTFFPSKTSYWDEIVWKVPGWVEPDWTTHPFDKYFGQWSSFWGTLGLPFGILPTYQQFYFEVNWYNAPPVPLRW